MSEIDGNAPLFSHPQYKSHVANFKQISYKKCDLYSGKYGTDLLYLSPLYFSGCGVCERRINPKGSTCSFVCANYSCYVWDKGMYVKSHYYYQLKCHIIERAQWCGRIRVFLIYAQLAVSLTSI